MDVIYVINHHNPDYHETSEREKYTQHTQRYTWKREGRREGGMEEKGRGGVRKREGEGENRRIPLKV